MPQLEPELAENGHHYQGVNWSDVEDVIGERCDWTQVEDPVDRVQEELDLPAAKAKQVLQWHLRTSVSTGTVDLKLLQRTLSWIGDFNYCLKRGGDVRTDNRIGLRAAIAVREFVPGMRAMKISDWQLSQMFGVSRMQAQKLRTQLRDRVMGKR